MEKIQNSRQRSLLSFFQQRTKQKNVIKTHPVKIDSRVCETRRRRVMEGLLIDQITRLYEVQLAQVELENLECENVKFDLKRESFLFNGDLELLLRRVSWLKEIDGKKTLIGEILDDYSSVLRRWSDNYWSHFIYPFKARSRPIVIRSLLNICRLKEGDWVLDPFCGSGTTLVEAKSMGINSVGVDVAPAYTYMSDVKCKFFETNGLTLEDFRRAYNFFNGGKKLNRWMDFQIEEDSIHPIAKLCYAYCLLKDEKNRWKAFFQRAKEIVKALEITEKLKKKMKIGKHEVYTEDARKLPFEDEKFDGVITSPPYGTAIDYLKSDFPVHAMVNTNFEEVKKKMIYTEGLNEYFASMKKAYSEMVRVTKVGGRIAIIIGNQVRGGKIVDIVGWTEERMKKLGCELLYKFKQLLSSTKVYNILIDWILVFERRR